MGFEHLVSARIEEDAKKLLRVSKVEAAKVGGGAAKRPPRLQFITFNFRLLLFFFPLLGGRNLKVGLFPITHSIFR